MTTESAGSRSLVLAVTDPMSVRLLAGLPEYLSQCGWDVHLVCGREVEVAGARVHVIPMAREPAVLLDVVALLRWVRLVRRLRPDVVLAGTPKAGLLGMLAARLCGVGARIYHLRGLRLETTRGLKSWVLGAVERIAMASSTEILSVSRSLVGECVSRGLAARDRFELLGEGSSNGVDV